MSRVWTAREVKGWVFWPAGSSSSSRWVMVAAAEMLLPFSFTFTLLLQVRSKLIYKTINTGLVWLHGLPYTREWCPINKGLTIYTPALMIRALPSGKFYTFITEHNPKETKKKRKRFVRTLSWGSWQEKNGDHTRKFLHLIRRINRSKINAASVNNSSPDRGDLISQN